MLHAFLELPFQFQKPPGGFQKCLLTAPIFHPQNPIRLRCIRLKHNGILPRILRTPQRNLGDLFHDMDRLRMREPLGSPNKEALIRCTGGSKSFDVCIRQVTDIDLAVRRGNESERRRRGRRWEGSPHRSHSKGNRIDRLSN